LGAAKDTKDHAFEHVIQQYQESRKSGNQNTFIEWLKQNGNEYSQAWDAENKLEKKYESLQDAALDDVVRALATMKSADSKIDFKFQ
jgi:hypothetical protein